MKVVQLTAENVKRLKAVDITPDQHVQVVGGRNAQGKSSVLDALWMALGGGAAARGTTRPVRDGQDEALVDVDLGDLRVTRQWRGGKTTLTVTAADGARYPRPQAILDALVGRLSFDPLEFTRLSARDQVTALLDVVEIDFDLDGADQERAELYERRTETGRQVKAVGDVVVDEKLPTDETSMSDLVAELRRAESANREIDAQKARHDNQARRDEELMAKIAELTAELDDARDQQWAASRWLSKHDYVDTATIEQQIDSAEGTNARVRANNEARRRREDRDRLRSEYDDLTAQIDALDQAKAQALAEAVFPVGGLGLQDGAVTYQGVPLAQASSAEQIRVSLAMAMALNPRLRVVRILDGSLLDADNLALIADMAREHDYQVWVERVGDADQGAVVIEDGQVVA